MCFLYFVSNKSYVKDSDTFYNPPPPPTIPPHIFTASHTSIYGKQGGITFIGGSYFFSVTNRQGWVFMIIIAESREII